MDKEKERDTFIDGDILIITQNLNSIKLITNCLEYLF